MEVRSTILNIRILRVAAQADRGLAIRAIFAWVVALRVDSKSSGHLVDHVIEGIVN